ncbi:hypothetical protein ZYGR_0AD04500 [Zygosaccharomyces rouxii]|uniref:ZYRO0G16522p n=2 Tax=Zygosaccharomyces rouxii TaxID=4956 RepID=C5E0Y2_ZYGRC|nr:uncharacterized protein ZYRO0G16522g [Zygosaccharomyces rouxii]KAH9202759.1 MAGE family-domain-containing protein [Zygosaccharomyces rouxii]GAV51267.1 hypothetical protein ZYGR_0AD04500 [Zygosaccharomyces rouxii]CAR29766.1 ZYRO0G16522p [Zygosaccharomyces rouxii]
MSQNDYEEDFRIDAEEYGDDKAVVVARKVVRFILSSCESQNTIIAKGRLQNVAKEYANQENCTRIPFNTLLYEVNSILEDIYGYNLVGLPPKMGPNMATSQNTGNNNSNTNGNNKEDKSATKASRFILLNTMKSIPELDEARLDQSGSLYKSVLRDESYVQENFNSSSTVGNTLSTHQDLVFKGLLTVVICIIVFSKNNILQQELFGYLESYGVPTDGSKIPILKWNIDDFVKTLDKREYVVRMEQNSDVEGNITSYRIGRRTQQEFGIDALVEMMRQVLGLDVNQTPHLKEDIKKNIGDSYA